MDARSDMHTTAAHQFAMQLYCEIFFWAIRQWQISGNHILMSRINLLNTFYSILKVSFIISM